MRQGALDGLRETRRERDEVAGTYYLVYRRHHEKQWENSLLLVVITPYCMVYLV